MRPAVTTPTLVAAAAVSGSQALVAAAYAAAGRPQGIGAAAACAAAWLLLTRLAHRAVFAMLFVGLGLTAGAALAGAPAWLCAAAAGGCVAAWDLSLVAGAAPPEADPAQERRVLRAHLGALAAGLSPGLLLAGLLGDVRIALPFGAVLALGLIAVAALDQAGRRLARTASGRQATAPVPPADGPARRAARSAARAR